MDNIKINENTKNTLLELNRAIMELQSRVQFVATAYLDAIGESPKGWQISKDFSEFECIGLDENN